MATDDCYEFGRGPCPCGAGIITVEKCIPDHPWAKESQASYTPTLKCRECEPNYAFSQDLSDRFSSLVQKSDLEKRDEVTKEWHLKLRQIEATEDFKRLAQSVQVRLARQNSAAARYRLLEAVGLTSSLSLGRFRRDGFRLSSLDVEGALKLIDAEMSHLSSLTKEAKVLSAEMRQPIATIKTGIAGLER